MSILAAIRRPAASGVTVPLQTLTPLYTGGIGQTGERVYPSGILGGLRRWSSWLAVALGDANFETRVWGETGSAKQVGLSLDSKDLKVEDLPNIEVPRADGAHHNGWFFGQALHGQWQLTLTRRGIAETDWQRLLLALRIQIRHGTFGAKDQFGLGVMTSETPPKVTALTAAAEPVYGWVGLHRAFFATVYFAQAPGNMRQRLLRGLTWRAHLRGSLRPDPVDQWRPLRHYTFGHLNETGSAVNVSASYAVQDDHPDHSAIRIWGIFPHTEPAQHQASRGQVLACIRTALDQGPEPTAGIEFVDLATPRPNLIDQLNKLAGLN